MDHCLAEVGQRFYVVSRRHLELTAARCLAVKCVVF